MHKILILSATKNELLPTLQWLKKKSKSEKLSAHQFVFQFHQKEINILISGAGITATAFCMGKLSSENFDLAVNTGICGAFDKTLSLGETVIIREDFLSEFGAEDRNKFLKASDLKLGNEHIIPKKLFIPKIFQHLKKVRGITVNTVHGQNVSIKKVRKLFQPQTESMEGAAFYYACNQNKWKCLQLRAVSNYVEKRNKNKWNIPLAIENLNTNIIKLIQNI